MNQDFRTVVVKCPLCRDIITVSFDNSKDWDQQIVHCNCGEFFVTEIKVETMITTWKCVPTLTK